ncbi:DUF3037 domain-containing protein [Sphingobacterium sp. HJSM2_6]|uniref:DUF3037 domain-containing protein n=1 Tax=Sphingobacterium sp. HJSM2_6 TaxID=3366264 RepID=UPI003BE07885
MQERTLYEYATVRLVPRVEREEFVNIGVLLFCKKQRYAQLLYHIDSDRCALLSPEIDFEKLKAHLESMQDICLGNRAGGALAALDQTERFRWLTAKRSTWLQCSPVHPGLCLDAASTHSELFHKLVL